MYGLTSQMRRASASVGMNIAEGVVERAMLSWDGFSMSRWVRPVSSNTNFCRLTTSTICRIQNTRSLQRKQLK
jgi:23S rRNA-intervening sequence protein